MNPNSEVNSTNVAREVPNSQTNIQNRPLEGNPSFNMNNPMGGPQPRPVTMELPNSNSRYDNPNYRQPNPPQQRNMPVNYQQGPRPPQFVDQGKAQNNYSRPNEQYQNSDQQQRGAQFPGHRTHPAPQPRLPESHQQMRPPLNQNMRFQNPQQIDAMRTQAPRAQANFQSRSEPENFKENENPPRNPPQVLPRKSSNFELNPPQGINNIQRNTELENKPLPESQNSSTVNTTNNIELNHSKSSAQPINEEILKPEEQNSHQISPIDDIKENEIKSNDNLVQLDLKNKEKKQTEKTTVKKIDCIASGWVNKNIKYFEENDTAKTPLTPKAIQLEKKKRAESLSSNLVKSGLEEDDYESGVDDTPVIHPNLRSIYQAPCKVAKIPSLKSKKISNKLRSTRKAKPSIIENNSKKNSSSWHSGCFGHSNFLNTSTKTFSKYGIKNQKAKIQNPEEELLAFFQNTKSFKKLKRDGNYTNDQGGAKDKLGYKPTTNGDIASPKKTPSKLPAASKKNSAASSPTKTPLKSPGTPGAKSLPKTPETPSPPTPLIKKVPMNKIQVGAAPSPNLKVVRSKVGSLVNTTHKPGGGNIKIESHKIDFSKAQPRIAAKNDQYAPSGGDKKITQVKLQWSAKSKIGSLENATYKPGGGDKKIESVKLDFKEKAKPKVGSKDNVKHVPGGGTVKIESQKLEFKAQSKVGSLDNVKHKPGGGDIKIFDDKTYLKQISGNSSEGRVSGTQSFGDLSIVREVEGRSAPGTPGRKTAIKIKKTTTINSSGLTPTLKNVTEVVVESQTPKKLKIPAKSPSKQQVKLTYSKLCSPAKSPNSESPVEVVKVPAKNNAPVLKPNLDTKDAFDSQVNGNKKSTDLNTRGSIKDFKNSDNMKYSSESSNLPEGKFNSRNDSGMTKFLQDEIAAHEKVGKMWKEMNNLEPTSTNRQDKQQHHTFSNASKSDSTNKQQSYTPQEFNLTEQRPSGSQLNQNLHEFSYPSTQNTNKPIQPQNYQPTLSAQGQQHPQGISQQSFSNSSIQSKEIRFSSPQQN